jgi:hypothetical protein
MRKQIGESLDAEKQKEGVVKPDVRCGRVEMRSR